MFRMFLIYVLVCFIIAGVIELYTKAKKRQKIAAIKLSLYSVGIASVAFVILASFVFLF